jgi:glycosyltransferase involved in cell wall biosynthesis
MGATMSLTRWASRRSRHGRPVSVPSGRSPAVELRGTTVVLIAYDFPPVNTAGASRVADLSRWLHDQGARVVVITATDPRRPTSLNLEAHAAEIHRIQVPSVASRPKQGHDAGPQMTSIGRAIPSQALRRLLRDLVAFPDSSILWFPAAARCGRRVLRSDRPSLVISSSPPFTVHLVARYLASRFKVGWIADLRDGYADNPYGDRHRWRQRIDVYLERSILSQADLITSVSDELVRLLNKRHSPPAKLVRNGVPSWALEPHAFESRPELLNNRFNIVYTGNLYGGRRDPSALFAAIAALGSDSRDISVHFYGSDLTGVSSLSRKFGIEDQVHVHGFVSRESSLAAQQQADALLLVLASDPSDSGVITAKVFEYLAAGKPILTVGSAGDELTSMLNQSPLGVVTNSQDELMGHMAGWLKKWRSGVPTGHAVRDLPANLRRETQWESMFATFNCLASDVS